MNTIRSIRSLLLLGILLLGTVSCERIFEYEGDCVHKVQFVFKKHRQALGVIPGREPDAFYASVNAVRLFVYDARTGALVREQAAQVDDLRSAAELGLGAGTDRCYLEVDLDPGTYRFVAWCGLDESGRNNAFELVGESTRADYACCAVKRDPATARPLNEAPYESVWHGTAVAEIEAARRQITPIELTKNTNEIAVWIQHLNAVFAEDEYEVVYLDANGEMAFADNAVAEGDLLEYRPHTTELLETDLVYNGAEMKTGALIARLSTARLMADHLDARLEVRNKAGLTVFSIPFIRNVLRLQTYTDDSQYYLDCEDTYNCSFYVTGDERRWEESMIIINNWVVVPDQKENQ